MNYICESCGSDLKYYDKVSRMVRTKNRKTYDTLKWIAMYLLPAAGTLYFALAGIWGLPYGEQVVGTITAVDTFLGVILGISTAQYNKANKAE